MLIIGSYPNLINEKNPLQYLGRVLNVFSQSIAVHILPCYLSDGDAGFAVIDWFTIDPKLGCRQDLTNIGSKRRLILDGIYNHISIKHKWALEFINTGKGSKKFHIYSSRPTQKPYSPRGGLVYKSKLINGKLCWIRQTFSKSVIDLNLSNPEVSFEINKHLKYLSSIGVWGVRLDSIAYYGKNYKSTPRHQYGAIKNSRLVNALAESSRLKVFPQLNCDINGTKYFPNSLGYKIPLQDFGYSSTLLSTILTENPKDFIEHIKITEKIGQPIIRAPRTHDGILLKTEMTSNKVIENLANHLEKANIKPRIIDNSIYEYNCSLPYAFTINTNRNGMWQRLALSFMLTSCLSGWVYLYLPSILGFIPEKLANLPDFKDPRSINRMSISEDNVTILLKDENFLKLLNFINKMAKIRHDLKLDLQSNRDKFEIKGKSGISISRHNSFHSIFNLSTSSSIKIDFLSSAPDIENNLRRNMIGPLGFAIWANSTQNKNL